MSVRSGATVAREVRQLLEQRPVDAQQVCHQANECGDHAAQDKNGTSADRLVASKTSVPLMARTTLLPTICKTRFVSEKCPTLRNGRAPMTMSARPSRMGPTRSRTWQALYWLSASVLTMTSAPSSVAVTS